MLVPVREARFFGGSSFEFLEILSVFVWFFDWFRVVIRGCEWILSMLIWVL